jgi:O-antigen ligase
VTVERLRVQLEGAVQALTVAFVVFLGLAAGNTYPWNSPNGRAIRWVALAELLAAALVLAAVSRRGRLSSRFALLLGALVTLSLVSAAWSIDSRLTLGRTASVIAVFAIGVALAVVAAERRDLVQTVLIGVVVGVVMLALIGLLMLWIDSDRAIVPATTQSGARYNGIGGNPNTIATLIALAIPAVVWGTISAASHARRLLAIGVLALLYGSIVASGSRGALIAALAGTLGFAVVSPMTRRTRLRIAVATVALVTAGVFAVEIPAPAKTTPVLRTDIFPPATPSLGRFDAQQRLPLESEVGLPGAGDSPYTRTLFTTSGRLDALHGALNQALERPLLGYGFGTEERVFVDRFYSHYSERPENSYIGTLLQLGVVGLGLLLGVLAAVLLRARRVRDGAVAACAGVVVSGLVVAMSQSFLTSTGSPAMAPFWLCALLLVGATERKASVGLGERQRHEGEVEPAQGDPEPRLDVVSSQHDGVRRQEHDDPARRPAAPQRDR